MCCRGFLTYPFPPPPRSTLQQYPDTLLGAMFSERNQALVHHSAEYFFDRNGDLFAPILDFYRHGYTPASSILVGACLLVTNHPAPPERWWLRRQLTRTYGRVSWTTGTYPEWLRSPKTKCRRCSTRSSPRLARVTTKLWRPIRPSSHAPAKSFQPTLMLNWEQVCITCFISTENPVLTQHTGELAPLADGQRWKLCFHLCSPFAKAEWHQASPTRRPFVGAGLKSPSLSPFLACLTTFYMCAHHIPEFLPQLQALSLPTQALIKTEISRRLAAEHGVIIQIGEKVGLATSLPPIYTSFVWVPHCF